MTGRLGRSPRCPLQRQRSNWPTSSYRKGATALITYDPNGVYGHPDHVHAHIVGAEAAAIAGLATWYEVTVDREYLHFVDTHVAAKAGVSVVGPPGARGIGAATVEISTVIDVGSVLTSKLDAIAAHRSQVPDDPTFGSGNGFADVYGYEWFIRHGGPTELDALARKVQERARRPA